MFQILAEFGLQVITILIHYILIAFHTDLRDVIIQYFSIKRNTLATKNLKQNLKITFYKIFLNKG